LGNFVRLRHSIAPRVSGKWRRRCAREIIVPHRLCAKAAGQQQECYDRLAIRTDRRRAFRNLGVLIVGLAGGFAAQQRGQGGLASPLPCGPNSAGNVGINTAKDSSCSGLRMYTSIMVSATDYSPLK